VVPGAENHVLNDSGYVPVADETDNVVTAFAVRPA
jgi:hypothetical protein